MIAQIKDLCKKKYNEFDQRGLVFVSGDYTDIDFEEIKENTNYELNYEDDFFYMLQINRFNDIVLFEFIMLGNESGYYKDWSFRKFVSSMKSVCEMDDNVYVNNYDDGDDAFFRAFFLAMIVSVNDFEDFYSAYEYCSKRCKDIVRITENRLNGIGWDKEFESDEKLFCDLYLTRIFKNLGFIKVRYNHGNKEFGKDYILETKNLFGDKEYYGVQVKAGNISGNAKSNILELTSQIKMAFKISYKDYLGDEIYLSKIIVACSGSFSENAKVIIASDLERYMYTNLMFLDKKYFLSLNDNITKINLY